MRTPEDGFYKRFTVECSRVQIGERGESGEEERGEGVECIRVKICGWGWEREGAYCLMLDMK